MAEEKELVLLLQKVVDLIPQQMLPLRVYVFTDNPGMMCLVPFSLRRTLPLMGALITGLAAIIISTITTVIPQATLAEIIFNRLLYKI